MYDVGYCAVCADILHIGHIRFINTCSLLCQKLIVGVMTDEAIEQYKHERPVIPFDERREIISSLKAVWYTVPQNSLDYDFSDHINMPEVIFDTDEYKRIGARVFLKRTEGISSTIIKQRIIETYEQRRGEKKQ